MQRKVFKFNFYFLLLLLISWSEKFWDFWFNITAQKMKFSIKDFFSKCDQIRRLQIFCAVYVLLISHGRKS